MSAVRFVLQVSGTMTVLVMANLSKPAAIQAQGIGTMQVVAYVTPAGPAWDGLAAAQEAAREFAAAPASEALHRTDHSLIQIEIAPRPPFPPTASFAPSASSASLTISIQHLRN